MALVKCSECGREISDKAKTCPHCGNPIEAIRIQKIDQQNRAYYKEYNKYMLWVNLAAFAVAFFIGYELLSGPDLNWPAMGVLAICVAIILLLSWRWVPWLLGLTIMTQKYYHIPKWAIIITIAFGYAIGGIVGIELG